MSAWRNKTRGVPIKATVLCGQSRPDDADARVKYPFVL